MAQSRPEQTIREKRESKKKKRKKKKEKIIMQSRATATEVTVVYKYRSIFFARTSLSLFFSFLFFFSPTLPILAIAYWVFYLVVAFPHIPWFPWFREAPVWRMEGRKKGRKERKVGCFCSLGWSAGRLVGCTYHEKKRGRRKGTSK